MMIIITDNNNINRIPIKKVICKLKDPVKLQINYLSIEMLISYRNTSRPTPESILSPLQTRKAIMYYTNLLSKDNFNLSKCMLGKYSCRSKDIVNNLMERTIVINNLRTGSITEIVKGIPLFCMLLSMVILKLLSTFLKRELIPNSKQIQDSILFIWQLKKILSCLFFILELSSTFMILMISKVVPYIGLPTLTARKLQLLFYHKHKTSTF